MRVQPFQSGEFSDGFQRLFQGGLFVFDQAGAPLKLVHGQPGEGSARPARRQGVAGAGHIIAQHGGRIASQKNRPRRRDFLRQTRAATADDFQMLRREAIGQFHRLLQAGDLDEPAVVAQRAFDQFAPRQLGQLPRDFLLDGAQKLERRGHQPDPLVPGAVFRLGQQIGGDEGRTGRVVGQHEQFARPRQQIHGRVAVKQALGRDDVGVARPENLLDRADGFRSQRQGGDGLHAADAVNLRRPGAARGVEQGGIDLSVAITRRADGDFAATGHAGQRNGHQRGRNQRRHAARNVDADAKKRIELFAHRCAVRVAHRPAPAQGPFGEGLDIGGRFRHRRAQRFIRAQRSRHQFGVRHGELVRLQLRAVEAFGKFADGGVAALAHRLNDFAGALLDDRIEQAGGSDQAAGIDR